MKKVIIILLVFFASTITTQAQETTGDIVKSFYETMKNKSVYEAMDNVLLLNGGELIKERKKENLKLRLHNMSQTSGKLHGYEVMEVETIADCLLNYKTVAKYEENPVFITFKFYKPAEQWLLLDFNLSSGSGGPNVNRKIQRLKH